MEDSPARRLIVPFLTPAARLDIFEIWQYIAKDSERHADLVEAAILATCELAGATPEIGHRRVEFSGRDLLFLVVNDYKRYSVAYVHNVEGVQILGVVHGARDIQRLF